jgi:hypothetical protein
MTNLINVSTYNGIINNLTVNGTLTASGNILNTGKIYLNYGTTLAGINVPATTEVNLPFTIFTSAQNLTNNISLSGDGITFTNISGNVQLYLIVFKMNVTNLDPSSTTRVAGRIYQNGSIAISMGQYLPATLTNTWAFPAILQMQPNDTVKFTVYNTDSTYGVTLYNSTAQITTL